MRYELYGTGSKCLDFESLPHLVNYLEKAPRVDTNEDGLLRVYQKHSMFGPLRKQGTYFVLAYRDWDSGGNEVTAASTRRIVRLVNG